MTTHERNLFRYVCIGATEEAARDKVTGTGARGDLNSLTGDPIDAMADKLTRRDGGLRCKGRTSTPGGLLVGL